MVGRLRTGRLLTGRRSLSWQKAGTSPIPIFSHTAVIIKFIAVENLMRMVFENLKFCMTFSILF